MPIIRDMLAASHDGQRARMPRLHGTKTPAGVEVDAERALQVSTVYACVRLIAEAIAQLPVHVYRRADDSRLPVDDHPLVPILTDRPNPDIDAGEFYRTLVGWKLLRGNALVYREIGGDGRTRALWPIAPTSVELRRTTRGRLAYAVKLQSGEYVPGFTVGRERVVDATRILHFRAFGLGPWGLSPVALARTKIGTAYAAERYGAGFFSRGAQPGGVLRTDGELTDKQWERLNDWWKNQHQGFDRSHNPDILEGGLKWENVGLPPGDAQFIETARYTAATIAGHIFFVPPHLIGDVERSTSWGTGIAEQGIAFVRYSLMPWIVRLERVLNQLFIEPDLYVKFNTAALERGDLKARYDAYAIGRQWGFVNVNEIKRNEDEAPIGPAGDVYLQPMNMVPAGTFDTPRGHDDRRERGRAKSIRDRHIDTHRKALARFFDEQAQQVLDDFEAGRAVRDFDRPTSDRALARLLASLGLGASTDAAAEVIDRFGIELDDSGFGAWMRTMGRNVATLINDTTFAAVAAATDDDELRGVFDTLVTVRAAQIAVTRVTESFGFGRQEAAKQAGARNKTWRVTSGNPRSSHAALDGETVPLGDVFSNGARWPGDTQNLSADEAAGCQCEMEISA